MPHDCIDWTTTPPTRKVPLLILNYDDDHVYTTVPKDFEALKDVARKVFGLGDVDVTISSSCLNLCNGVLARITESAWEHLSPSIGCATVEVVRPIAVAHRGAESATNERDVVASGQLPFNADEAAQRPDGGPSPSAKEAAQDKQPAPSDHDGDHDRAPTPENQYEEPWEEVRAMSPRKQRRQRRVVSEDEDDGDGIPPESQVPAVASPPKQKQEIKKERQSDHRSEPESQQAEQPDRPIKQEKGVTSDSQPQSQPETQPRATRAPTESSESHKLMIRVSHRPTKQESKFTTKGTTKVNKVLAGACRSFGLDASCATLYLIVSTEDEEGEVENLFPCDKNDTIARAGAEYDVDTKFLLKIAGEA